MSLKAAAKSDKLISAAAHANHTLDWLELEDEENGTDADDEAGKCERWAMNCSASTFIRKISTSPMPFSQPSQMRNTPIKQHDMDKKPVWTMEFRQPASDYIRFRDTLGQLNPYFVIKQMVNKVGIMIFKRSLLKRKSE